MQNGTILQYFHWYSPADGTLWNKLKKEAPRLAELGFTALWLPPAFKCAGGGNSTGYDVYDLYDLGEFDQKGTVRTKYGTKDEYIEAIHAAQQAGLEIYADLVFNHKGGGDEAELIKVRKVDPENRNVFLTEPFDIEAFTRFTFPGRKGKYSPFIWDHRCFSGVDYDNKTKETAIYSIQNGYGDGWDEVIDQEKGNYDYLMYDDIDFRNPGVLEEMKRWGEWYWKETGLNGVRLDALKHISPRFIGEWLDHMRNVTGQDFFAVGEYWAPGNLPLLLKYIEATAGRLSLFDASLHHNLEAASKGGKDFDLSGIFNDTLVAARPDLAVTVAANHDTQPLQALEAPLEQWFKPLAYALLLLREKGYPCVFLPDLESATYRDKGHDGQEHEIFLPACEGMDRMLQARKSLAYGLQRDYLDHPNCIGWTRQGDPGYPGSGCAVLMSNGEEGFKTMEIGPEHKGRVFKDLLDKHPAKVTIDDEGKGEFQVSAGSVSVWILDN
jgi:alpha-amylase